MLRKASPILDVLLLAAHNKNTRSSPVSPLALLTPVSWVEFIHNSAHVSTASHHGHVWRLICHPHRMIVAHRVLVCKCRTPPGEPPSTVWEVQYVPRNLRSVPEKAYS